MLSCLNEVLKLLNTVIRACRCVCVFLVAISFTCSY